MLNLMFWSFRFHTCLLSSVAFLYRSFRNEHTWFLYLNLNVVSQSPMYVSLVVGVVTLGVAASIHGARVWFTAVTIFVLFIIVCGFADFGFIVVGYNCLDVIHAAVT